MLWQFAPTKKFEESDFSAFLEHLPKMQDGRRLRHVVEVRHDSFFAPAFITLLRKFEIPVVFADHAAYPAIADLTGDFVYARLQKGKDAVPMAYSSMALDEWARRVREWASGNEPGDLPLVDPDARKSRKPRDVFLYFIHEGKVRAPAAAMALMTRINT